MDNIKDKDEYLELEQEEEHDKIVNVNISNEIKTSFLDYSMSVIVSRAIPDVRDGLKPVHRRILYTMYEEGMTPDKKHQKSANAVGAVMGHYHPHGDAAIYDSMVRMAQDFTYRHVLVDGHGNFGSIDGDPPAASRYTEARLSKISLELLRDINKNTVDFVPNYDDQRKEPSVLPSRFPNILVNGNMGIAVGMATNIPPHNLKEVIDGAIAYIDNPDIDVLGLMQYIKGPDFPTAGTILGNSGIKKAYETGKGTITIRGKAEIHEEHGKNRIIITEIPYQVNKSALIQRIAELVRDKVIDGISNLNDESALEGIKVVIDLKKEANAQVVLNHLYKHTQLQVSYGINFLMLINGRPKTVGLKDILYNYIEYQKTVIYRRTQFDLDKALKRAHILEGLKIALDHIDAIIKLIRESNSDEEAASALKANYGLTDAQVQAILEMKLRRLTGLERDKIELELQELLNTIEELKGILASDEKILNIIKEEMREIALKYCDERRTNIDMTAIEYIEDESLIPVDNVIVSLTNKGYVKRVLVDTYRSQNRGGVGIKGMTTNEEDYVEKLITCSTHDDLLFFTNFGKVYRIRCYEVPEFSRQSKGLPIVNLLALDSNEVVNSIIPIDVASVSSDDNLMFITKSGLVKKTNISEFQSIRKSGKIAITLKENDELISVKKTKENDEIIIASNTGRMVRFNENEVRLMGRGASGVKGIDLSDEGFVIGAEKANKDELILVVTENGYGKKTDVEEYRLTHRGGKGVKALNVTDKNGLIVAFKSVQGDEDIILTTNNGIVIRLDVTKIPTLKRNTQGVRLMTLKDNQTVTSVTVTEKAKDDEDLEETQETQE